MVPSRHLPPHRCSLCGERFLSQGQLTSHCFAAHPNVTETLRCNLCDRRFRYDYQLANHKRSQAKAHPSPQPANCSYCKKEFGSLWAARNHELDLHVHRRYVCHFCGENFARRDEYKTHSNEAHEGAKTECPICHKTFKKPFYLKKHLKQQIC